MARRKRSYVPKIKGCCECSHRRIDCDRTEPSCKKCSSKGIECSGFGTGIKYKFRDGFAPGRKNARKPRQDSNGYEGAGLQISFTSTSKPALGSSSSTIHQDQTEFASWPTSADAGHVQWPSIEPLTDFIDDAPFYASEHNVVGWEDFAGGDSSRGLGPQSTWTNPLDEGFLYDDVERIDSQSPRSDSEYGALTSTWFTTRHNLQNPIVKGGGGGSSISSDSDSESDELESGSRLLVPSAGLNPIDAWNRYLLKHFCDRIAPEMVVMDGAHNGWKHLVLPIALQDDLVLSSVLAASAFHITSDSGPDVHLLSNPRTLYAHAIRKLQCRRELDGCDRETRQTVILSIIVLLVVVMINGCSDFPVMFRMLESALHAIGGDDELERGDDMALFCLRQIRKMRIYAAPLLSQQAGLHAIISSQANQSFDCLRQHCRLYPEYAEAFHILEDLRHQAFNIYLDRILPQKSSNADPDDAIEHFIQTVQSYPPDSPGQHVLIWPCFIAASASRKQVHRDFFQQFLTRQYRHNGFANLLRAMDLLLKIWSQEEAQQDWPALLPEPQVFIM